MGKETHWWAKTSLGRRCSAAALVLLLLLPPRRRKVGRRIRRSQFFILNDDDDCDFEWEVEGRSWRIEKRPRPSIGTWRISCTSGFSSLPTSAASFLFASCPFSFSCSISFFSRMIKTVVAGEPIFSTEIWDNFENEDDEVVLTVNFNCFLEIRSGSIVLGAEDEEEPHNSSRPIMMVVLFVVGEEAASWAVVDDEERFRPVREIWFETEKGLMSDIFVICKCKGRYIISLWNLEEWKSSSTSLSVVKALWWQDIECIIINFVMKLKKKKKSKVQSVDEAKKFWSLYHHWCSFIKEEWKLFFSFFTSNHKHGRQEGNLKSRSIQKENFGFSE